VIVRIFHQPLRHLGIPPQHHPKNAFPQRHPPIDGRISCQPVDHANALPRLEVLRIASDLEAVQLLKNGHRHHDSVFFKPRNRSMIMQQHACIEYKNLGSRRGMQSERSRFGSGKRHGEFRLVAANLSPHQPVTKRITWKLSTSSSAFTPYPACQADRGRRQAGLRADLHTGDSPSGPPAAATRQAVAR
jgi:hypothetical protein